MMSKVSYVSFILQSNYQSKFLNVSRLIRETPFDTPDSPEQQSVVNHLLDKSRKPPRDGGMFA